jgi:DNA-binding transcriptional regulator GbsR (MarR family)
MARAPTRDEEAMRTFVEQMARMLADWGFPRMAGRVLFVMMGADEPA